MFLLDDDGYWEHDNYILMANKDLLQEVPEKDIPKKAKEQLIFQHDVTDLLKTGLSQNHLQTMGLVLAFFFFPKWTREPGGRPLFLDLFLINLTICFSI